jgi:hypothetical protein
MSNVKLPALDPLGRSHGQVRDSCFEEIRIELERAEADRREPQWKRIQEEHPSIGKRSFYRWVQIVRDGGAAPIDNSGDESKRAAVDSAKTISKHMPEPVSPDYMLRKPGARGRFDLLSAADLVYADALKLRAYSLKADPNAADGTGEAIRLPNYFDKSIQRRDTFIQTALKIRQEIYNVVRMEEYYREIMEIVMAEIGMADPAARDRLLVRMSELDARYLMTVNAPVL